MAKVKKYPGAVRVVYSPANQAYFVMWHDQVLRILGSKSEAQIYAEEITRDAKELKANPFKYWRRPPKGWWHRCTRGVDESARSYGRRVDSARVCGATWARKSDVEKKAVRREAERLEENPCSGGCWGWGKVFG